ncbi:MAG: NAD-dependent epimerase/dehydratase family protein [Gammaproteobacteria bacterium]|nr:MAG: NAD-dependent epimerase/dehydratase family protein [Gammaproteobacteria bacterium]
MKAKQHEPLRVMVIGGTGFIGCHVVQELLARGHLVTVFSRKAMDAETLFAGQVSSVQGDLDTLDADAWALKLAGFDAVVFAAGVDERATPKGKPETFFYKANVVPTRAVLRGAEAAGVRRAVLVTSVFAWLHRQKPELRLTDYHPYIRSRIQQEETALACCDKTILTILELPYVFGAVRAGQTPLWKVLVTYVRTPVRMMVTAGGANMVSVRTVAKAIAGAIEYPDVAAIYPVGDENLSWKDLLVRLCTHVGRHDQRVTEIPKPVFRDMTRAGAFFKRLFGIRSGLDTARLVTLLTQQMWFDPKPSQKALHYQGGDLDEALKATVDSCPETPASRSWRKMWDWVLSHDAR